MYRLQIYKDTDIIHRINHHLAILFNLCLQSIFFQTLFFFFFIAWQQLSMDQGSHRFDEKGNLVEMLNEIISYLENRLALTF